MARKKIEPITNLGDENKLTVQKSLPLFALWRSDLTLAEFKILDTYLSRIDSHKPDRRTVIFEKGELEKLLGVKRIKTEELDERLKHLGTPVRIDDNTSKNKRFTRVSLFEKAIAQQDEHGLWQVELTASQSAMKYFFNIENLGYLRYKLRCITSIKSRYTYIMFTYLEHNRFRKSWEVSVEELKQILDCNAERYKEFKYFKTEVLARVQKEMHEKTECRYAYEPIKKGRSVVAVRFTVETLPRTSLEEIDENQITIEQWLDETDPVESKAELWEQTIKKLEFTQEQTEGIRELLNCVPQYKMPQSPVCEDSIDLMRYHYMATKVSDMNARANVRNKYLYLRKILEKDANLK